MPTRALPLLARAVMPGSYYYRPAFKVQATPVHPPCCTAGSNTNVPPPPLPLPPDPVLGETES